MSLSVHDAVMTVFSEVLKIGHLHPNDNFFELGGTSLSAAIAVTRIENLLGLDVSLRVLMENPVIDRFSNALAEIERNTHAADAGGPTEIAARPDSGIARQR